MNEESRIDNEAVKKFFDQRVNKKLPYRYNYVNYQDNNPSLVLERDQIEKELIAPQLQLCDNVKILDIGCGVGRWGDYFKESECCYVGIDYSEKLLSIARDEFVDKKNFFFICSSFQNLNKALMNNGINYKFDIIILNGVLMYINDDDIEVCMSNLVNNIKNGGIIYIKESVSRKKRLTLQKIHSKELGSDYSAIYRSIDEYSDMIKKYLPDFIVKNSGDVWPANMEQRKETTAYYWILTNGDICLYR